MTRFEPNTFGAGIARSLTKLAAIAVLLVSVSAHASIDGDVVTGSVDLTAGEGYILVADGASIYSWGYSKGTEAMQLPGPTLIVTAGETFNVTLSNNLPAAAGNVSIVFPGLTVEVLSGGVQGELAQEATSGSTVTYRVTTTETEPGTYQYHSGTQPDLQVEMGLYGALIVRPSATPVVGCESNAGAAYDHGGACFDREYLFLLSQMDIDIHQAAELQAGGEGPIVLPAGAYHSEYWLMNGRAAPDTLAPRGRALLPHQPYNILPQMYPGEKLLIRLVGAGREQHPFHTHGNHVRILARDGRLIVNDSGSLAGPTLFTIPSLPGGTVDAIFEWTGKDLGWDIYGHADTDPLEPNEWAPDHGKPIPVDLPSLSSLAFGGFYSGSPFLGAMGALPPGEGGLNPAAGFTYMWHSHAERELVNNDVFPGGMLTMLVIQPFSHPIDETY